MSQLSPQLLVTILASLTPTKYSWLASLAFLVYDHALTFDAEVANIWSRPSSFSGILFIWTRYFGLASLTVAVTGAYYISPDSTTAIVTTLKSSMVSWVSLG
ncbi:hypothetical protein JB92DRAFT_2932542 [Gautieria morchelliformis]|nr:hypothetical protein JB92DRAFT_2932542 [Gautieria morchelliformis]